MTATARAKKSAACMSIAKRPALIRNRIRSFELAALPFSYDAQAGAICRALPAETGQWLHDPGKPIPAEITRITGIDDAMVAGKKIDAAALSALVEKSDLIVAHNARFDRPFCEACARLSATAVGLLDRGCAVARRGARIEQTAMLGFEYGFFYDSIARWPIAKRACICWRRFACRASATKPRLRRVGQRARRADIFHGPTARLSETKDLLRERRYRWNPARRVWGRDVEAKDAPAEREWLEKNIYADRPRYRERKITPYARFTARAEG